MNDTDDKLFCVKDPRGKIVSLSKIGIIPISLAMMINTRHIQNLRLMKFSKR